MRSVEFFIFPDALGLDIVGPLDVFSTATELLRRKNNHEKGYSPIFSAEKTGLITLSSGLELKADISIGTGKSTDIFFVPGGLGVYQTIQKTDLIRRIRSKAIKAKQIVSVCGGAFILAACGLLNGKKATTHWQSANELTDLYPDVNVIADAIYVRDGNISTSAGVTAGIDLALALVEEDYGSALAMDVARMLVVYLRRAGGQSQFSSPMELRSKAGSKFNELYDWILHNLEKPLSVELLAEHAAMSPRHFSRIFSRQTGITPGKYVEKMRLDRARELLESSDFSVEVIAEKSGFAQENRLRRAFTRQLGITPSQYRIHFKSS